MIEQTFTTADVDTRDPDALKEAGWFLATKTTATLMRWVDGGFRCLTQHGYVDVEESAYLGIDADGYPYPIAAEVYDATYVRADTEPAPDVLNAYDAGAQERQTGYPTWGPPPTLSEIALAKTEGLITPAEAKDAAARILTSWGLHGSGLAAQVDEELGRE